MKSVRRLLLIGSAAAFVWAALVVATGGVQWRIAGVVVSSRESSRALGLGVVLLLAHAVLFREAFTRDTDRLTGVLRRVLPGSGATPISGRMFTTHCRRTPSS